MKCWMSFVFFLTAATIGSSISLPPYFKKCKKDDSNNLNQCILKTAHAGFSKFIEGDSTYHIAKMNPISVPKVDLAVGNNLVINLTDVTVSGLDTIVLTKIDLNLKDLDLDIEFDLEKANLEGKYLVDGRILILPITGNGLANVTYVGAHFKFSIKSELKERNGKQYINPIGNTIVYEVKRVHFYLTNLFNGDPKLGDDMNKFLDENWKEVNAELGKSIGDAIGEVLTGILSGFFNRVPFSEFFQ